MKIRAPIYQSSLNSNIQNIGDGTYYSDIINLNVQDPYLCPYNGYYFIARRKIDNNGTLKNFYISVKQRLDSETSLPLTIYPGGTPTDVYEVKMFDMYGTNDLPPTVHSQSATTYCFQVNDANIYALLIYFDTADNKIKMISRWFHFNYAGTQKYIFNGESTAEYQSRADAIVLTVLNKNVFIQKIFSGYYFYLWLKSDNTWKVCFGQTVNLTETSLSLNQTTERVTAGYFVPSSRKLFFLRLNNGNAPTIFSYMPLEGTLTNEGTLTGFTSVVSQYAFHGGYYIETSKEIFISMDKTYLRKNNTWYTIETTPSTTFSRIEYETGEPYYFYTYKQRGFFNNTKKNIYIFYNYTTSYLSTTMDDKYSALTIIGDYILAYYQTGIITDLYYTNFLDYTPCSCTIYKKIFEPDRCNIEDEIPLKRTIELYDDNYSLLFWGISKEGYEYTRPRYSIEYTAIWDSDLNIKLNVAFTNKKVSEMLTTIIQDYCTFLYIGEIDTTTNTYNIKETRTIKEFLQWAAYVETKIITIDPDGKLYFKSGFTNNGDPYQITIQDPQKKYKLTNYYPTKFYVIGGTVNGQRLSATQINDPNGEAFVYYATNITSQTELNNILAKIVAMKSQLRFRLDFIQYDSTVLYRIGTVIQFSDESDEMVHNRTGYIVAAEFDPLKPSMPAYLVYNTINYPQQDQQQERTAIIEQDIESIDNRVKNVEQGSRLVAFDPRTNSDFDFYIYSNSAANFAISIDVVNKSFSLLSGSYASVVNNLSQIPSIPASAKGVMLSIWCSFNYNYAGSINRDTRYSVRHPDASVPGSCFIYHHGVMGVYPVYHVPFVGLKNNRFEIHHLNYSGQHYIGFTIRGYWI